MQEITKNAELLRHVHTYKQLRACKYRVGKERRESGSKIDDDLFFSFVFLSLLLHNDWVARVFSLSLRASLGCHCKTKSRENDLI